MDLTFPLQQAFDITLGLTKAERLQVNESAMTHAMVISAVHIVDGKPVRFKVENSWGEDAGDKGYFVMTEAWFDEYVFFSFLGSLFLTVVYRFVYQIVVPRGLAAKNLVKIFDSGNAVVLPAWDPMGALA